MASEISRRRAWRPWSEPTDAPEDALMRRRCCRLRDAPRRRIVMKKSCVSGAPMLTPPPLATVTKLLILCHVGGLCPICVAVAAITSCLYLFSKKAIGA